MCQAVSKALTFNLFFLPKLNVGQSQGPRIWGQDETMYLLVEIETTIK